MDGARLPDAELVRDVHVPAPRLAVCCALATLGAAHFGPSSAATNRARQSRRKGGRRPTRRCVQLAIDTFNNTSDMAVGFHEVIRLYMIDVDRRNLDLKIRNEMAGRGME
ncbi:unnamed protein product [Triticum turgidum subsp. durum]|uniref:Uncharacterized protein n=1 Tax=Triticum turgidum subsp. durum TaxID=4567 RepID=A0A9R1AEV6_TRITD|nr:unnamed protein product [Triticum turgidum subsp. durum]